MQDLLANFETIAGATGFTVCLVSGERTCQKQLQVSAARCSHHLLGNAIDINLLPVTPLAVTPGYEATVRRQLVSFAKGTGYRWGGDFREPDPNHFDDGRRVGPPRCCAGAGPVSRGTPLEREEPRKTQRRLRSICCPCCKRCGTKKRARRARRTCKRVDEPIGYPS